MTLAIITGNGDLPKLIIKECQKNKQDFIVILIEGQVNHEEYKKYPYHIIQVGHVSQALSILKDNKVTKIVFAGGVKKPSFTNIKVDKQGAVLLSKIIANKIFGDDSILTTITNFFAKKGFKIVGADEIIKDIISTKAILTKKRPTKSDLENIQIAKNALEVMSDIDIGQSIIVQQKQIIGVEAAEGTDNLINRCVKIQFNIGDRAILVKMKKKNQNTKIDLPTIGEKTINNLIKGDYAGIAFKAGSTLILNKEKIIKKANENNIFIIAI